MGYIKQEQSILKVDVLKDREMDKCKYLSDLNKGQIVMSRCMDQSCSTIAGLVWCSWYAVVSTYLKGSKKHKLTKDRVKAH